MASDRILRRFAPPYLAFDSALRVFERSSRLNRYLVASLPDEAAPLPLWLIPSLRPAVQSLLDDRDSLERVNDRIERSGIELSDDSGDLPPIVIDLKLERLDDDRFLLVLAPSASPEAESADSRLIDRRPFAAHEELDRLRADYARQSEEFQDVASELSATRQQLMTTNEELSVINEELLVTNDELTAANRQLAEHVAALEETNVDLANFLNSTHAAKLFLDEQLRVRRFTQAATEIMRIEAKDIGRPVSDIKTLFDAEWLPEVARDVMTSGKPQKRQVKAVEPERTLVIDLSAFRRSDASIAGVTLIASDITEFERYRQQLQAAELRALRRLEEIERLYRRTPQGMALLDGERRYVRINESLAALNGFPVEAHIGRTTREILPLIADVIEQPIEQVLAGEAVRGVHMTLPPAPHRDGIRHIEVDWYPHTLDDGSAGIGVTVTDVTDRREQAAEIKRMMQELQHRVKNILASVMALVRYADRSGTTAEESLATLAERLTALSNTHNILTDSDWRSAELGAILDMELTRVYGPEPFSFQGPKVQMNTKSALALSLAIHEMATNAAKYGALSTEDGQIDISWRLQDAGEGEELLMEWREQGGPKVVAPTRSGFGSELIASSIEHGLDGSVEKVFAETGFSCVIRLPLAMMRVGQLTGDSGFNP